jgi:BolA protein
MEKGLKPLFLRERQRLENKLTSKILSAFKVKNLFIENESHMHGGKSSNSHFKIIMVSEAFRGMPLIRRHKLIYELLNNEMNSIHALSLHLFSDDEEINKELTISPNCVKKK